MKSIYAKILKSPYIGLVVSRTGSAPVKMQYVEDFLGEPAYFVTKDTLKGDFKVTTPAVFCGQNRFCFRKEHLELLTEVFKEDHLTLLEAKRRRPKAGQIWAYNGVNLDFTEAYEYDMIRKVEDGMVHHSKLVVLGFVKRTPIKEFMQDFIYSH